MNTNEQNNDAIEYIMDFYNIDRETAIKLYSDEIDSLKWLWDLRRTEEQTKTKI